MFFVDLGFHTTYQNLAQKGTVSFPKEHELILIDKNIITSSGPIRTWIIHFRTRSILLMDEAQPELLKLARLELENQDPI